MLRYSGLKEYSETQDFSVYNAPLAYFINARKVR